MDPLILMFISVVIAWTTTGYVIYRWRQYQRAVITVLNEADREIAKAREIVESVYRVRLSCPLCDWTDTVASDQREVALAEGNRRISEHNADMNHPITGEPRSGYFRGLPIN